MSEITETAEGFTIVSQSNYHIYNQTAHHDICRRVR